MKIFQYNRYLRYQSLDSQDLWRNVKEELVSDTAAYLIFDDTVINKKYGYNIDSVAPLKEALTRRQYSGNEHNAVQIVVADMKYNIKSKAKYTLLR